MRLVLAIGLALGLAACAGGASPDGGVANYDALRQAHEKCAARGGTLALKTNGNAREIQDYACKGA
jgi:hypothetical protein